MCLDDADWSLSNQPMLSVSPLSILRLRDCNDSASLLHVSQLQSLVASLPTLLHLITTLSENALMSSDLMILVITNTLSSCELCMLLKLLVSSPSVSVFVYVYGEVQDNEMDFFCRADREDLVGSFLETCEGKTSLDQMDKTGEAALNMTRHCSSECTQPHTHGHTNSLNQSYSQRSGNSGTNHTFRDLWTSLNENERLSLFLRHCTIGSGQIPSEVLSCTAYKGVDAAVVLQFPSDTHVESLFFREILASVRPVGRIVCLCDGPSQLDTTETRALQKKALTLSFLGGSNFYLSVARQHREYSLLAEAMDMVFKGHAWLPPRHLVDAHLLDKSVVCEASEESGRLTIRSSYVN
eukprot:GHVR01074060.1.p1 GENE.GHVR01074060.1~~GHVR01074060.1.p1  ORF type:complete len:353 (+),score=73.07 GHVR01074060.1:709-1767(+)